MTMQSIDRRYAESLPEIYDHIKTICGRMKKQKDRPLLWFRGQEYEHYYLEPNLFRGSKYVYSESEDIYNESEYAYNESGTYGRNHLREAYRFQNFMSRNYDKIDVRMPQTMIEWQEVMQHYGTKTRLMDWSESLTVALGFALEAFIKPVQDLEAKEHRRTATPTLWILDPVEMNKEVYHAIAHAPISTIEKALDIRFGLERRCLAEKIQKELQNKEESGIYFNLPQKDEGNMNIMLSLSSLEILRKVYAGREYEALNNLEMNPFFYLLLRYFSDGIPVGQGVIPPLSIIHPYHSSRIKGQRGVFTVFPYYILNKQQEEMNRIFKKDLPIAMEYMEQCVPHLHKIQILNPENVAEELLVTGAKRGNLYPDMQSVSQDIENVVDW